MVSSKGGVSCALAHFALPVGAKALDDFSYLSNKVALCDTSNSNLAIMTLVTGTCSNSTVLLSGPSETSSYRCLFYLKGV